MQVGRVYQFRGNRQRYQKDGLPESACLAFEMSDGIANGAVCFHLYPLLLPAAAEAMVRMRLPGQTGELHVRQRHLRYE